MTVLRVVDYLTEPALLRRRARPVRAEEVYDDRFCAFVRDLRETLAFHRAAGLAATQLDAAAPDGGVWDVFAMADPEKRGGVWVVLNCEVLCSEKLEWGDDGCLSFRNVPWKCRYPSVVHARGLDDDWRPLDLFCDGVEARVVAHEAEHLRGRLMLDQLAGKERDRFLARVAKATKLPDPPPEAP